MGVNESDEALMERYRAGDVAAFEILFARHEKPVWGFVRRFLGHSSAAQDVLQEIFLRVVASARDWKPQARLTTWLYTIARNLCVDHVRRAQHRDAASLDAQRDPGDAPLLESIASGGPQTDGLAMSREIASRIEAAVAALPCEQREVFLLREMSDLPFVEIARAVGASEPTVKSRMRYALEKLREALADCAEPTAAAEAR